MALLLTNLNAIFMHLCIVGAVPILWSASGAGQEFGFHSKGLLPAIHPTKEGFDEDGSEGYGALLQPS